MSKNQKKTTVQSADPITASLQHHGRSVLAFITGVSGPSYRPLGAAMAFLDDGTRVGTLSSGCIESDLALHAEEALASGKTSQVLYGEGSPYFDIQLPCGGGLEITLLPNPNKNCLQKLSDIRLEREPITLCFSLSDGSLEIVTGGQTGRVQDTFYVRYEPETRFAIFGKGPEASSLAALVQATGYPNLLYSPDQETREFASSAGTETFDLRLNTFPGDLKVDPWTAIVLFFHDHDWEPPILKGALKTPAFYIGSQGSQRARDARMMELAELGVGAEDRARLRGPIGLIPSVRDARTLAVSVLAEVLEASRLKQFGN